MKKTTKLLSIILAFVMALSCMSMMASAARTSYKTSADLENLKAYSPYGTVTRLTSEERLSILCDSLDTLLASANIKMDNVKILWIEIRLNFTSLNSVLDSIDSIYDQKGLLGIIGGTIKNLNLDSWRKGMTREGVSHQEIIDEVLELLSTNANAIGGILTDGLSLGLIGPFIKGLDLSPINKAVKDVPGLIKALVFPLMGRQDDDQTQRNTLGNRGSNLLTVAQNFVTGLFTKPMNWTSYREGASGNDLGYTLPLPSEADGTSRYFVKNADGSITQFDYQYAGALGGTAGYSETVTYTKSANEETKGSGIYLYEAPANYNGDKTLKWYKAGDPSGIDTENPDKVVDANGRVQSSYWLPTVAKAFKDGSLSLAINGADSVLGLVYKFAPYLFREMAPTVLNGSAKKLMAEAFDVKFTKIGLQGEAAVTAEATATGNPDNFFTKAQDYYVWEYSDYKVIDGVPYYRYQNEYFKGEIPKNISAYYSMFNWNWTISADFMDEFIPTTVGETWALDGLNKLVKKAIDTMILSEWTIKGKTYQRADVFPWSTANGNADLLNNLKVCARNFFKIAPEEIVDEYYAEAQFYNAMMFDVEGKTADENLHRAVNGLVCELVKLIMPQIKFADNIIDQPITAIAAIVVRELCTQLMPTYNFDAMIYANYGNASNKERTLASHTADEWLDITLYMGVNLGMYYLRNLADLGEDSDLGYYSVMEKLGALPALSNKNTTAAADAITFDANAYKANDNQASWLVAVDWIVDWALDVNTEWCWHFNRLIDAGTVDLATYQNPFNKINSVILTLIPDLEKLLNTDAFEGKDYGSGTFLEKLLKDGLVDSIVNLDVPSLLKLFKLPAESVLRKNNIADTLIQIVINIINKVTLKVCGGANLINTSTIKSVDSLLNQANLKTLVVNLIGKLYAASNTYKLLDPILPIANFFIGWTTDPQKYAEPAISLSSSSGDNYLLKSSSNSIRVANGSAGMLQKHRNSSTVDAEYQVKVNSITADNGASVEVPNGGKTLAPGEAYNFNITTPAGTGVTKITVNYTMTGKDGKQVGTKELHKVAYYYYTETADEEYVEGRLSCCEDSDYIASVTFSKYTFTEDIFTAITEYKHTVYGTAAITNQSGKDKVFVRLKSDAAPTGKGGQYFTALAGESHVITGGSGALVGGWPNEQNGTEQVSGLLYAAKSGVTADTFKQKNAEANNLYGLYDMGKSAIKYGSVSKKWIGSGFNESGHSVVVEKDFIFYNDFNIGDVMNKYLGYNLRAESFSDTAKFNAYDTALRKVVELACYPKLVNETTGYVATIQPQIPDAIKALDNAYAELVTATADVDVSAVQSKLDELETNPDRDINFQDYKLFEYFQYEKQRTSARNMIKSVTPPAALENHIDSVWGNDLVTAIVNAQTGNVKMGVNATVEEPSAEDTAKREQEIKDFRPASHSELEIANQAQMLQYYHDFMTANPKSTDNIDKTFLNNEITYAEAQNYDETKYSADSWARYTKALAAAKDAAANSNKESEVFDAKYELMAAQNALLLKERSMKEVGYMNEELIPLIQHANAIIANYDSGLYTVKDGTTAEDAFAQLVKALGVKYDVTVDGKEHAGILYDYSALTFQEYDRIATAKNKKAVDGAADKLRAAIENFVCTATVDSKDDVTNVDQTVRFIQGIAPNSLKNVDDLKAKLTISSGVTPVYTASKANQYGTGARVELKASEAADAELYATYFVVIYGDVNGDGAVDAFDALEVDHANHTAYYMGDVYDDAADINGDGIVDNADYGAIVAGIQCKGAISQIH